MRRKAVTLGSSLAVLGTLAIVSGCSSDSPRIRKALPTPPSVTWALSTGELAESGRPSASAPLATWSQVTPLPGTPVAYSRTVALGHRLFVLGGRTVNLPGVAGAPALGVYAYEPATTQWEEHTSLPVRIDQPNIAAVGNKIYVVGGTGVRQTFVYDPETRAWSETGTRPVMHGIGASAVAVSGSKIYVAGGQVPSASNPRGMRVTDFASYDTAAGTWQALPPMPEESAYFGGAFIGDVLFTVGGSTEQREVARPGKTFAFDVATQAWSERAVALSAVSSFADAALEGRLYIIGGIAGATGRINPETQVYDPTSDVWTTTTPLIPSRFAMSAAVLGGKIYVAGGVTQLGESEFVPVNAVDILGP